LWGGRCPLSPRGAPLVKLEITRCFIYRKLIVPTSRRRTARVGMQPETLRVSAQRTQSVLTGVTTQSVGTIDNQKHRWSAEPQQGLGVPLAPTQFAARQCFVEDDGRTPTGERGVCCFCGRPISGRCSVVRVEYGADDLIGCGCICTKDGTAGRWVGCCLGCMGRCWSCRA
jgi:hypothetical protein